MPKVGILKGGKEMRQGVLADLGNGMFFWASSGESSALGLRQQNAQESSSSSSSTPNNSDRLFANIVSCAGTKSEVKVAADPKVSG